MSQSVLDIILRSKKQGTGVKDSTKEIDDLGKATSKFGEIAKGVAVAGVGALVAGLTYAVNQAMETERVMRATEQVIRSTGGAAGMTADEISGLAGELSAMSGVDDELIQGSENVLLTFTSIGKNVFPQATAAALDMSAALGTDLQSSVTMIGKALQDPIAGVSALSKVGVNFNDTAKDTIKRMVEMNDVAGAQAFILKELNVEFGGMAEALGSTLEGKINKARNAIDNLSASLGEKLLPVLGRAADAALYFMNGVGALDEVENKYARTVAFLVATQGENSMATQTAISLMRDYLKLKQQVGMTDNEARIRAETAALYANSEGLAANSAALEGNVEDAISLSDATSKLTAEFIFQKAAANMTADAALKLGLSMGVVKQGTVDVLDSLAALRTKYDLNRDGAIDASEATKGYNNEVLMLKNNIDQLESKSITITTLFKEIIDKGSSLPPVQGPEPMPRAGGGPVAESMAVNINELTPERFVPYAGGSMVPAANNLGPVSIVVNAAPGQNVQQIAQAVSSILARKTRSMINGGYSNV